MSLLSVSPPQINVTTVRQHLPKGDFSIMTEMLKKFLSFMNLTVSMTVRTDVLSSALHDDTATIMIKVTRHVHVVLVDFSSQKHKHQHHFHAIKYREYCRRYFSKNVDTILSSRQIVLKLQKAC